MTITTRDDAPLTFPGAVDTGSSDYVENEQGDDWGRRCADEAFNDAIDEVDFAKPIQRKPELDATPTR